MSEIEDAWRHARKRSAPVEAWIETEDIVLSLTTPKHMQRTQCMGEGERWSKNRSGRGRLPFPRALCTP